MFLANNLIHQHLQLVTAQTLRQLVQDYCWFLVACIEAGVFIEMSELSAQHVGSPSNNTSERGNSAKSKICPVTNILEWIQGFGMYMAVLSRKQLERIPDLLAYQSIIIEGYLEFEGNGCDDRCFRQNLWQKVAVLLDDCPIIIIGTKEGPELTGVNIVLAYTIGLTSVHWPKICLNQVSQQ